MPTFQPGKNIAIKIPSPEYEQTVVFYRDILQFPLLYAKTVCNIESTVFEFGGKNLWLDKSPNISQAEIWLEIVTDDVPRAKQYLDKQGIQRRDEIEALPLEFNGFWIAGPSNIIHLVNG